MLSLKRVTYHLLRLSILLQIYIFSRKKDWWQFEWQNHSCCSSGFGHFEVEWVYGIKGYSRTFSELVITKLLLS